MTNLFSIINRLRPSKQSALEHDLVFGLPLDVDGRQVYPVYQETGSANGSDAGSRQPVGYLEIEGSRADLTRFGSSYRWPLVVTGALVVFGAAALSFRRWT